MSSVLEGDRSLASPLAYMATELTSRQRRLWLGAAIVILLVLTALQLRSQGRLWLCACGELYLWAGDIQSAHNSQHLFDPYSFTHLLHGLAFFWVLTLAAGRFSSELQVGLTVLLESVWEVLENSRFIIERYREATIALGYEGNTIVNSVADIGICTGGFLLGVYLGLRRSIVLFAATEVVLAFWIRDGLLLNIVMLIYPFEAIKSWQIGP